MASCCKIRCVNVVKMRWLSWLIALAFVWASPRCLAATDPASAAPEPVAQPSPVLEKPINLTADAMQLAQQLGIAANIRRVDELRNANSADRSLELVQNKQAIMQAVLVGMLQVRATSAQISYDVFEASQVQTALENRRDRALKVNSIANFVSGGVSELGGGAFQLVPKMSLDNAGNIVEMVGGGIQTGLSAYALRQQQGQKRRLPVKQNMLAPIFDQSTNQDSKYPRTVWKYLNDPVTAGGDSRRSVLVKRWLESGRLPGRQAAYIAALTGNGGPRIPVTIDILSDRVSMLTDVNALVSRIERLLLEILLYSDVQTGV
jgi:hypothetical protein